MADTRDSGSYWDHLVACLDQLKSAGDFASMKRYPFAPNPVLRVGDEVIRLPLDGHGVKSILKFGRQAPFGKGNQTIVDVSVRRTWEISADKCHVMNPAWDSFLGKLIEEVCLDSLSMEGIITAEFHKLLLYEPGSFFRAHKDSQKTEGMIATLVICLPSEHEGGEVHLSHAGQLRAFDTSESSLFDTTALTWFSDVTHEVKNIVSGHRLVLTYNIIQKSGLNCSASIFNEQVNRVDQALAQCREHDSSFSMKIYSLDHQYSRAGLSLSDLKGRDRAVCQSLSKLCFQHGFYFLLGHMTKEYSRDFDSGNEPDLCGIEFDDDDETARLALKLDVINRPDGAELAQDITVTEDQFIKDPYENRTVDSFEASRHFGNDETPEYFRYYDSVAIICCKAHLASLNTGDIKKIMLMLMQECEENINADGAPGDSLALLERLVESLPSPDSVYTTMIEWAWKHEYQSLYIKSIISSIFDERYLYGNYKNCMGAVAKIINAETRNKTTANWDRYLDGVVDGIEKLTTLAEVLTAVESAIIGSLKPDFSAWKFAVERKRFDSQKALTTKDEAFIISRLDNSDWLNNCPVPALGARGEKALIKSLVSGLLTNKLEVSQIDTIDAASKILQSTASKVALDPSTDFNGKSFSNSDAKGFLDFLQMLLKHGLQSIAAQLLDATWTRIDAYHGGSDATPLEGQKVRIECFLETLARILQEYQVPYLNSTRELFTFLIGRYVYADAPSYPKQELRGWSCNPRGCGCEPCEKLDEFLQDEDASEGEFEIPGTRTHLKYQLPKLVFRCQYEGKDKLKVTKLAGQEFEDLLRQYKLQVARFEKRLVKFRTGHMEGLLGDAAYRELVMLENLESRRIGS